VHFFIRQFCTLLWLWPICSVLQNVFVKAISVLLRFMKIWRKYRKECQLILWERKEKILCRGCFETNTQQNTTKSFNPSKPISNLLQMHYTALYNLKKITTSVLYSTTSFMNVDWETLFHRTLKIIKMAAQLVDIEQIF
jgi:hypothetical protein